ncbi:O-antigen ligase family protein [uncultured Kordia sp.]|uniref:O-antigen ligase family protein n=1 Tax=uncultured Kordia sp. TaxID=507699 RepID=UPI00262BF851|nr:O-antigen ligase family protein [uncultured Kordia sp.]
MFEQKASFAAFPLIIFTLKKDQRYITTILKAFVVGSVIAYVLAIINAFWSAIDFTTFTFNFVHETAQDKDVLSYFPLQTNYFLGNYFSFSMQSSILALYFVFSIGIMHFYKTLFSKKFRIITSILLALGVIQLFSLMGVLSLIVLAFYVLFLNNKKTFYILIASIGIVGVIVNKTRIVKIVTSSAEERKEELIKLNERAIIWSTAVQVISESPVTGSGIRKAQQKLNKLYPKGGDFGERSQLKNLHAHNTFLQTFLETGIIGLGILLSFFFLLIKKIRKSTNAITKHISVVFIVLIFLNFLSESVFNIYVGISFFMFFYCLFTLFKEDEKVIAQELV